MRAPRMLVVLLLATLPVGCVEGEPRFFDDESELVTHLRVNAYSDAEAGVAKVEVHGLDDEEANHAFRGTITVKLEAQDRSREPHTYQPVGEWTAEVGPDDFSTPTVPFYTMVLEPETFPQAGTYRVWANATIDGRPVMGEPALFEWQGSGGATNTTGTTPTVATPTARPAARADEPSA